MVVRIVLHIITKGSHPQKLTWNQKTEVVFEIVARITVILPKKKGRLTHVLPKKISRKSLTLVVWVPTKARPAELLRSNEGQSDPW